MVRAVNQPTVESLAIELDLVKRAIASCFLCAKGVMARYGFSKATLYRRLGDGRFPRAKRYPGNVWRLSELVALETAGQLPRPVDGR